MFDFNFNGKFWETVSKGTGGAVAPWRIRREGKANSEAKRDEMLMIAQTENDIEDIKSGKKKYTDDHKLVAITPEGGELSINGEDNRIEPYINLESFEQEATVRQQAQIVQEHINLTKTVLLAEEALESSTEDVNDVEVDQDWFTRWRDNAEKVSNEDLQKLWAKALAGEVTTPGSYSLRTLDFLKNLSQLEAEQIARLAPYVIDGAVHKLPYLDKKGLIFSYLLEMENLGIISGVNSGGLQRTLSSLTEDKYHTNITYGGKILLLESETIKETKYKIYKLTKLGSEILKLGTFPLDYEYLECIGQNVKQSQLKVLIADITNIHQGGISYANPREL
ncbi:DUF2806 domain-containing protein [Vibrio splendidus]|uniref:DUF2806 domain-containing protein n=1 Tax=Vibrio splendidus TaxID=29497 RepID=UPI000769EE73|nr:DUF2806 domain-containing protein [Vibrio splendidus]PHX03515.1 hypothetical protein VSPL_50560 [Vibrio splendidus]